MANSSYVTIWALLDPPYYSTVPTDYTTSFSFTDSGAVSSEVRLTLDIQYSDPNYAKLLAPLSFVENGLLLFELAANGEHYNGVVNTSGQRALIIKEVTTQYLNAGASIEINAFDATLDMRRIKNDFNWRQANVYDILIGMAGRYGLTLVIAESDKSFFKASVLPALPQSNVSDYDFLAGVLRTTGRRYLISSTIDSLHIVQPKFSRRTEEAWAQKYTFDITNIDQNNILSAQVSIEKIDKEDTGGNKSGSIQISEDGSIYQIVSDQYGELKGGLHHVSKFDVKTGQWGPVDITIEEALNPAPTLKSGTPLEGTKVVSDNTPLEPVYLLEGYVIKTGSKAGDLSFFTYLNNNPVFNSDVKIVYDAEKLATGGLMAKYSKLTDNQKIYLFLNTHAKYVAIGSANGAVLSPTYFSSSTSLGVAGTRLATQKDRDDREKYLLFSNNVTVNRQRATDEEATRQESLRQLADAARPKSFYPKTPESDSLTSVFLNWEENVRQRAITRAGVGAARAKSLSLADSTAGQLAPDTLPTYQRRIFAVDKKEPKRTLDTYHSGAYIPVPGKPTYTVDYLDPDQAQQVLDADTEDTKQKELKLRITLILTPDVTPNNPIVFTGQINPLHDGVWWCTEVIHELGANETELTCNRNYLEAQANAGVPLDEPKEGESFVAFDQYGVQKGVVATYDNRYYFDETIRLIDSYYDASSEKDPPMDLATASEQNEVDSNNP